MTRRQGSGRGFLTPFWLGAAALLLGCGALSLMMVSRPVREFILGPAIPTAASGLLGQSTVPGDTIAASCRQLIERALQASSNSCSQIGSNKVCYGNVTLQARLVPGAAG